MIRSDWASAIRMAHDFVRRLRSLKLFAGWRFCDKIAHIKMFA